MRPLQLNSCGFSIRERGDLCMSGRMTNFAKSVKETSLIIYAHLMGHEERVPLCSKF